MKPQLVIPIIGPTLKLAKEQIKQALPFASILEIRSDLLKEEFNLPCPLPIILTCRSKEQGGHFEGTKEELLKKIDQLVAKNPTYIDVEFPLAAKVSIPNSTKLIVSYHDHKETPKDLTVLFKTMKETCPDAFLYKIATFANSTIDALRLLAFLKKKHSEGERLLGICMGELGIATRLLSPIFQNPFTFASLDASHATAPAQLSAKELIDIYSFNRLSPHTKIYGLIGDPVDKSQSHLRHNESFRKLDFDGIYVKFKIRIPELKEFFSLFNEIGIQGLSITMPLKEAVLPFVHEVTPYGAVNTIVTTNDKLLGFNTDASAALDAIEKRASITNKRILILGAGGVGKALALEAKNRGGDVVLLNRDGKRGLIVANSVGVDFAPLSDLAYQMGEGCDILIQATAVGMDNTEETLVPEDLLTSNMIVLEAVNRETRLLREAQTKGCAVIPGLEMFQRQAAYQFKLWKIGPHSCSHC